MITIIGRFYCYALARCKIEDHTVHRKVHRSALYQFDKSEVGALTQGRSWLPLEGKLSSEARLMRCAVQCRVSVDFRRIRSAFPPHPSRLCRDTFPSRGRLWNASNSNLSVCLIKSYGFNLCKNSHRSSHCGGCQLYKLPQVSLRQFLRMFLLCAQTTPWAIMASATFRKPATLAPTIRSPGRPHSTEAS